MESLAAALKAGNRRALSKALTLIESTKGEHQILALELLKCLQSSKDFFSIGVSGPPGAGKSSLIETLGSSLVFKGDRVAVLAVDPSSELMGGSILGDKTRMPKLSTLENAYVRPSPNKGSLGGVTRTASEAMLLCAHAGYSKLLIETVGVGQSEIAVASLVDCMCLVLPPVGGDDLQSIKRGITEVADIILVNKADGPTRLMAKRTAASLTGTMRLMPRRKRAWSPVVLTVSAHTGEGFDSIEQALNDYRDRMIASGELDELRAHQRAKVAWRTTQEMLLERLGRDVQVKDLYKEMLPEVEAGGVGPRIAAIRLIRGFMHEV